MKKKLIISTIVIIIVIIILIISIVLFWNHGTKNLKCVKAITDNGTDRVSTFTFRFKNDKMEKVESKNEIIIKSEAYKNNIDALYKNVETRFGSYRDEKGIFVKTSKESDRIIFTLTVDAIENVERVELVGSSIVGTMNYEEAKKELESRSFECE